MKFSNEPIFGAWPRDAKAAGEIAREAVKTLDAMISLYNRLTTLDLEAQTQETAAIYGPEAAERSRQAHLEAIPEIYKNIQGLSGYLHQEHGAEGTIVEQTPDGLLRFGHFSLKGEDFFLESGSDEFLALLAERGAADEAGSRASRRLVDIAA